jgi:hypothetical protein
MLARNVVGQHCPPTTTPRWTPMRKTTIMLMLVPLAGCSEGTSATAAAPATMSAVDTQICSEQQTGMGSLRAQLGGGPASMR